eukprot:scaffold146_cov265-Pinguiococcus_pyrenoidosus.AAC.41
MGCRRSSTKRSELRILQHLTAEALQFWPNCPSTFRLAPQRSYAGIVLPKHTRTERVRMASSGEPLFPRIPSVRTRRARDPLGAKSLWRASSLWPARVWGRRPCGNSGRRSSASETSRSERFTPPSPER